MDTDMKSDRPMHQDQNNDIPDALGLVFSSIVVEGFPVEDDFGQFQIGGTVVF